MPNHSPPFSPWAGDGKEKGYRKEGTRHPCSVPGQPGCFAGSSSSKYNQSSLTIIFALPEAGRAGRETWLLDTGFPWGALGTRWDTSLCAGTAGTRGSPPAGADVPPMWAAGTDHGCPPQESVKPGFGPCSHRALLGGPGVHVPAGRRRRPCWAAARLLQPQTPTPVNPSPAQEATAWVASLGPGVTQHLPNALLPSFFCENSLLPTGDRQVCS